MYDYLNVTWLCFIIEMYCVLCQLGTEFCVWVKFSVINTSKFWCNTSCGIRLKSTHTYIYIYMYIPTMLIPFIVIIETIRNLIRPGTLAVRLTANIIAGHLLLTLLGNNGPSIRHTLLIALITAQILLLILEAAVAVIQSYVFAILRTFLENK